MAGGVEEGIGGAWGLERCLTLVVVRVRVQGLAGGRGEDVPLLRPQVACESALAGLFLLVLAQELEQLVGGADGALAGAGLRVLGLATGVDLLGAVAGLAPAAVAA